MQFGRVSGRMMVGPRFNAGTGIVPLFASRRRRLIDVGRCQSVLGANHVFRNTHHGPFSLNSLVIFASSHFSSPCARSMTRAEPLGATHTR